MSLRIVFMGTPEFAVPSLEALIKAGYDVIAVYTQPDRPKGRGKAMVPPPVKVTAQSHSIPVYQPEKISRESAEELAAMQPDLYVTAAFGQILSQKLLDIPKYGCINVHASLLPKHRGSAPINHAILQGDEVLGVTTMMTVRKLDAGDMLLKAEIPNREGLTAGEATEELSKVGAALLVDTLHALEAGTLERIPQNEDEMTYDPMLDKSMGIIGWTKGAKEIVNLIHGLNPWPGASTAYGEGRMKIHRARVVEGSGAPGEVIVSDSKQGLVIAAGENAVKVEYLQMPGGKEMKAVDYLRGHPIAVGTVLKEIDG